MNWDLPLGYRGLIFDCDGTLVDSMPLHYEAWVAVLTKHDLKFSEAQFYELAGVPVDEIVRRLSCQQGRTVDVKTIAAERDAHFHSFSASRLLPVEAVVDIARRFRGRLPLAVATGSTRASADASLAAIGIRTWFDAVISSDEVARPKPAPDVYLRAAERIALNPIHCVAFEDSAAGLEAALAAGMFTVDVRPWLSR